MNRNSPNYWGFNDTTKSSQNCNPKNMYFFKSYIQHSFSAPNIHTKLSAKSGPTDKPRKGNKKYFGPRVFHIAGSVLDGSNSAGPTLSRVSLTTSQPKQL